MRESPDPDGRKRRVVGGRVGPAVKYTAHAPNNAHHNNASFEYATHRLHGLCKTVASCASLCMPRNTRARQTPALYRRPQLLLHLGCH